MNARANPAKLKATAAPASTALSDLIAIATKAKATAAELLKALIAARGQVASAQDDAVRAEHAYQVALLADEATLAASVEEKQAVAVRRDRTRALVEALESRLAAVETDTAEQQRRVRYDDAKSKSAAAVEAIRNEYPEIGRQLRALLGKIAEAEVAVAGVNNNLPVGGEALPGPEHLARSELAKPKVILSEEELTLWCRESGAPIPDAHQGRVTVGPDGKGILGGENTGAHYGLTRRRFRRVEYLPATLPRWADRLASKIALPGLDFADDDLWHPEWASTGPFEFDHSRILTALAETEKTSFSRIDPAADDREAQVELVPIVDSNSAPTTN